MLWEYLVTYLLVLAIVGGHIDVKYSGARIFVIKKKTFLIYGIYVYILDPPSSPLLIFYQRLFDAWHQYASSLHLYLF